MKKVFYLLLIGGAMLICPHQSKADPYYLVRTIKHKGQLSPRPNKAPSRPLCIDITANVITVPENVVGYMLTLSNEEESYTYYITGTTLFIPQVISGVYELAITNGSVSYQGDIEI